MAETAKLARRFAELAEQLNAVLATKHYRDGSMSSGHYLDNQAVINWKLKAKHLIALACGEASHHSKDFAESEDYRIYETNLNIMDRLQPIFEAAREDFEGGYCNSYRTLIQAELFDSELDQAKALYNGSYHTAAAVIAGVVLETTLRQLCDNHGIAHGKLDKMNADLAKAGQYNTLKAKQVTAWAAIRNSAAHGRPEEFSADDVSEMLARVEAFVAEQL